MFVANTHKPSLLSALLLMLTLPAWAFQAPPALDHSLLWKIEGNGIATSYLYGTIHLLAPDEMMLHPATPGIMADMGQLVLELDMDEKGMEGEMMRGARMHGRQSLKKLLTRQEYTDLNERIKTITGGVGVGLFKRWMPAMLSSFFVLEVIGTNPASVEDTLMTLAHSHGLEVYGLETVEQQLNIFHQVPYEEQAQALCENLYMDPAVLAAEFNGMVDLYLQQDVAGLYEQMQEGDTESLPMEALLDQRNQNWISQIGELAADTPTFFAVGAGHLGGQQGVISLLRQAGYTVTAVPKD